MAHVSTFLVAMCLAGASATNPAQANAPPAYLQGKRVNKILHTTAKSLMSLTDIGLSADPLWRTCQAQRGVFDAVCDKCCFGGVTRMHCNEENCRLPCQPHSGCWLDDDFISPVSPAAVAPQAMPAPKTPAPKTPAPKTPAPMAPTVPAYFKGTELASFFHNDSEEPNSNKIVINMTTCEYFRL